MTLDKDDAARYARHFVLSEVGVAGQKKLLGSKVLVIGAGGLGSCAMYLAAAGVGTIGIADGDNVEPSNLQRQIIHRTDSLGMPKSTSAARTLYELNPKVKVEEYGKVTADNIFDIIERYDFVLDCTDRFETKFLINDACVMSKKPYCHAGVVRFEGQVMTVLPGKGPCLRCLLGEIPKNASTCAEVGVMGAMVGVIGSIQALEAIKFLLGKGELLVGKVLTFDGLTMEMRVTPFPHISKDCKVCNGQMTSLGDYSVKECGL